MRGPEETIVRRVFERQSQGSISILLDTMVWREKIRYAFYLTIKLVRKWQIRVSSAELLRAKLSVERPRCMIFLGLC